MRGSSEFRRLLEEGDVTALVDSWARLAPGMPQPDTRENAEIALHLARTVSVSVEFKYRAWSHRWLTERGLPSRLPDRLRPKAERLYPVIAEGVGISVNTKSDYLLPALLEARGAMEYAVNDCYANGDTDPALVRARMREAKVKTLRALLGTA